MPSKTSKKMKPTWCHNEISDLTSVLHGKKPSMDTLYPCVEDVASSLESIDSRFVKNLKQYNKTLIRVKGQLSLVQQTRIFRLERLVKILKEILIILENYAEWANGKTDVTSHHMINTMSQRMHKEIQNLSSDWDKEDDVTIDVSNGTLVEKKIQRLHTHINNILQAMKLSSHELNNSGILTPVVNNFINGEGIFSHEKNRDDDCFTHSVLAFCGRNLFKTEKVDLEQENNLTGVEFMSMNVIDTLLYQMPNQYRIPVC